MTRNRRPSMPVLALAACALLSACFATTGREKDNAGDLETVEITSLSRETARHKAPEAEVTEGATIPDVAMKVNSRGVVTEAWKGGDRATDRLAIACYEEVLRLVGGPAPARNPAICEYVIFKRYLVR